MLGRDGSHYPVSAAFLPECSRAGEMLSVSSRSIISLPGQMGQSSAFSAAPELLLQGVLVKLPPDKE